MIRYFIILGCLWLCPSLWGAPTVVVSISPLGALTTSLMKGIDTPFILQSPEQDAHEAALKPSDLLQLERADLVIWIGPHMEHALAKNLAQLPAEKTLTLENDASLKKISFSQTSLHHHATAFDPHLWLDPDNMAIMASAITKRLSAIDPQNASLYTARLKAIQNQLKIAAEKLQIKLTPFTTQYFFSFHNSLGYFNARFGLNNAIGITDHLETSLSLHKVEQIRKSLIEHHAKCLLTEPGIENSQLKILAQDLPIEIKTIRLFPKNSATGIDSYIDMLNQIATTLINCAVLEDVNVDETIERH